MNRQRAIELISGWQKGTVNNELKWEATSSLAMFLLHDGGKVYSIEKKPNVSFGYDYDIVEWDANGNIMDIYTFVSSEGITDAEALYIAIQDSDHRFSERVDQLDLKESGKKDRGPEPISMQKIKVKLGLEKEGNNEFVNIRDCSSFFYVREGDPNYVEPPFIQLSTYKGFTPVKDAEVILVSAPGATGKSALSSYLSNKMGIPLFDLGKHQAVGANSLIGLLVNNLSTEDYVKFKQGLGQDKCSMIIDGLDEGEIRSGTSAYESFLEDIVNIARGAEGMPFLMLGRSRTVLDTAFYLEMHDVKVACLQIEPFTLVKANEFIDKALASSNSANRFEKSYTDVKKYIVESIQGFFKNEGELKKQSFSRFIGYAPVLMAISSLLKERADYNRLLLELQSERKTNIDLVITIIEKILYREREKVLDKALPGILENYDEKFKAAVTAQAFSLEKQCARILYMVLGNKYSFPITDNPTFNHVYNEKMNDWVKNHPFLLPTKQGRFEIQNIVFESYIIAKLACNPDFTSDVIEYLSIANSNSYLLFDFYDRLVDGSRIVDHRLIRFLFDSFRALDSQYGVGSMELLSTIEDEEFLEVPCELSFYRDEPDIEKTFRTVIPYDGVIELPSSLRGVNIDVPLPVRCDSPRLDFKAPVAIHCTSVTITSADVVILSPDDKNVNSVSIDCAHFSAQQLRGTIPNLINRAGEGALVIRSKDPVSYPFTEYRAEALTFTREDKDLAEKYSKLRKTISYFRSNGKSSLARYQDKIRSRICNTPIGRAVLEELLETKILFKQGILYVLNTEEMDKQLGLSYNDIHSGDINEKTKAYLRGISIKS